MNEVSAPRRRYGWPREFRKGDRVKWTYEGCVYYAILLEDPPDGESKGFVQPVVREQPEHLDSPGQVEVSWLSFA
jgi:hypothetical protein